MTSSLDTRDMLLQQRNRCLADLRELGPKAAKLVTNLEALEVALATLSEGRSTLYAGHRNAIDAIVAALRIHDRAMSGEELSIEITEGGWLSRDERARFNVLDSIDYHTRRKGNGKKRNIIRALNGLVGLYEWPDEKFAAKTTEQ